MKKFVTFATIAAMTASMLCTSALFVSAADTNSVTAILNDQIMLADTTAIRVPVCFDQDITFTEASFDLGITAIQKSLYKTEIKSVSTGVVGVEVALSNSTAKLSSAKAVTVKKGSPICYVTIEVQNKSGEAVKAPDGLFFKLDLKSSSVIKNGTESLSVNSDNSVIQSIPLEKDNSLKVSFGDATVADGYAEVPVCVTGELASFNTEIKASNGAVIESVDFKIADMQGGETDPSKLVFLDSKAQDKKFENTEVAVLKVKLADGASSCKLSFRYFDTSKSDWSAPYPAEISNGYVFGSKIAGVESGFGDFVVVENSSDDAGDLNVFVKTEDGTEIMTTVGDFFTYKEEGEGIAKTLKLTSDSGEYELSYLKGLKGDADLSGKVTTTDAPVILSEFIAKDFDPSATDLDKLYSKDDSLKDVISKFGMDKVVELGVAICNVDENEAITTGDAIYVLKYTVEADFGDVSWESILNS